jgi:antitoxin VapB
MSTGIKTAKLFKNGRSQAVRLPYEFRFKGKEVFIRRDNKTGCIILSEKKDHWKDFFEMADSVKIPDEFMSDRQDAPPQLRELF